MNTIKWLAIKWTVQRCGHSGQKVLTGEAVEHEVLDNHDQDEDFHTDIVHCIVNIAAYANCGELGRALFQSQ